MRISDWSSDVCSSDLRRSHRDVSWRRRTRRDQPQGVESHELRAWRGARGGLAARQAGRPVQHARRAERLMSEVCIRAAARSEEHTSELQSLIRISYAVFCLKKKHRKPHTTRRQTKCK